jgi:hypothetical protein
MPLLFEEPVKWPVIKVQSNITSEITKKQGSLFLVKRKISSVAWVA